MKPTPSRIAIGIVAMALFAAVAISRFAESGFLGEPEPAVGLEKRFCVGVEHPDSEPGLVCVSGADRVIAGAIDRLGVPAECAEVSLPKIVIGDRIVLNELDGRCIFERVTRLPGAHRLICGAKINVNLDGIQDLELLPGIGKSKAHGIVESRREDGPFSGSADLTRVHGIGEKTAERLDPWLEW
ncbi:MAG: hypothetical protein GY854_14555 [Deltaproteobacteria bacterium]|nr:hypothetical protein [Deltaproteobacteria bacterium]